MISDDFKRLHMTTNDLNWMFLTLSSIDPFHIYHQIGMACNTWSCNIHIRIYNRCWICMGYGSINGQYDSIFLNWVKSKIFANWFMFEVSTLSTMLVYLTRLLTPSAFDTNESFRTWISFVTTSHTKLYSKDVKHIHEHKIDY